MIEKMLDLHIHSRYSRACSRDLVLPSIARACETRGINIVATGDFTHPAWFKSLREELEEERDGVYKLRAGASPTRFIIGAEVASIKKHKGAVRRIHLLLFAPRLAAAAKFNSALAKKNCNLTADGRPILGLTVKEILQLALEADESMMLVPAHAWTPWFGVFGSKGGYDSLEDAFEELTPRVQAIETGLSSDPAMNWRVPFLDNITLISNSDAHSTAKLGREANAVRFESEAEATYREIRRIIQTGDRQKFLYTVEFYPEEGKYHYDGHRECGFSCPPAETKKYHGLCPKCAKPLVVGVMNRVEELSARSESEAADSRAGEQTSGSAAGSDKTSGSRRIPYRSLVPLPEIIADTVEVGVSSKAVAVVYDNLTKKLGSEFYILLHAPTADIAAASSELVAEAVARVRRGEICIKPGYDGVFGTVKVFGASARPGKPAQTALDFG